MYRKSYCTAPSVSVGIIIGIDVSSGISKMLKSCVKVFMCWARQAVMRAIMQTHLVSSFLNQDHLFKGRNSVLRWNFFSFRIDLL